MNKMTVTSSPHIRNIDTTGGIMLDVILALLPAAIAGIAFFGFKAALVMAVTVASAVISEYFWCKATKKARSLKDLSAIVTGLLLGMNLPPNIPLWMAALGSVVAIIVVKQMFGGIGQNFANPAITARIVLMVSFPTAMTTFAVPFADTVSSATPLSDGYKSEYLELFFGNHPGCIGETSAILLLAGGVYLVLRRVITPEIPLAFIGTTALFSFILGTDPLKAVLSGGLLLGAIFMATDYVTSPPNRAGKIIFGIGAGIITVIIRELGNIPEGVSFSILLMNILTPHIIRLTRSKPFGGEAKADEK